MSNEKTKITPAALAANTLENFIAAITPGGIEAQEARGQQQLVHSETLPFKFNSGTREELEAMGVKFGEAVDDLFAKCTLPTGWKKEATDHHMWSKLVDAEGRERASIFYKAAFYDRSAFVNINHRFNISAYKPCDAEGNPADHRSNTHLATVIEDGGKVIQLIGVRAENASNRAEREAHQKAAEAWLNERYPDWQNRTAYWDEQPPMSTDAEGASQTEESHRPPS